MRTESFGQAHKLTPVDTFGVWLSAVQVKRRAGALAGKRVGDFGCGFQATLSRTFLDEVAHLTLCDVALAEDLRQHEKVTALEGPLPATLSLVADASLDVVLCLSVLEHLDEPEETLAHFRRIVSPGGVVLLNVPSWRGKTFLELSAFRLGLSPRAEMDDHKMYYDPKDLWPMLVRAGFKPSGLDVFTHKFGLNTFAVCRP